MKVLVVMNVMGVMDRLKSRVNRGGDRGNPQYYTTIGAVVELENSIKNESFDLTRHIHNNPSQKS